jgi:hypothetical protein
VDEDAPSLECEVGCFPGRGAKTVGRRTTARALPALGPAVKIFVDDFSEWRVLAIFNLVKVVEAETTGPLASYGDGVIRSLWAYSISYLVV